MPRRACSVPFTSPHLAAAPPAVEQREKVGRIPQHAHAAATHLGGIERAACGARRDGVGWQGQGRDWRERGGRRVERGGPAAFAARRACCCKDSADANCWQRRLLPSPPLPHAAHPAHKPAPPVLRAHAAEDHGGAKQRPGGSIFPAPAEAAAAAAEGFSRQTGVEPPPHTRSAWCLPAGRMLQGQGQCARSKPSRGRSGGQAVGPVPSPQSQQPHLFQGCCTPAHVGPMWQR